MQNKRNHLSRRQFLNLLGGTASLAALAACTSVGAPAGSAAGQPAAAAGELVFWFPFEEQGKYIEYDR